MKDVKGQAGMSFNTMVSMIMVVVGFLILYGLYVYFSKSSFDAADNVIFGAIKGAK
jgi:hypothetical protein